MARSNFPKSLLNPSIKQKFTLLPMLIFLYLGSMVTTVLGAKPSAFSECASVQKEKNIRDPLTRQEKLQHLSNDFSIELSRFEQCQENESASSNNDSQGTSNSNDSLGTSGAESSNDFKEKITIINSSSKTSLSSNLLKSGESSLALTDDGKLMLENFNEDFEAPSTPSNLAAPPPLAGRTHEKLQESDNIKILKEQIKARADKEDDPEVKAALMKRHKEL